MKPIPTYSVIIPHYNSPELLARCLASVPDEEWIQVIVVDDNSSSDIVDFSHFPGLKRKNTEVIFNKAGHGAGHARNLALPRATGKWLLFADADDYFTNQAWTLFEQYSNHAADIIYFGIISVDSDTLQPTERYQMYDKYVQGYIQDPTAENADWLRYRHDVPWGKMIRRELVTSRQIVFGETRYCNDTLFSCRCALAAKSIAAESKAAYCVTDSQSSLTKQQSIEAIQIRFSVICQKNLLLQNNHLARYQMPILFYLRQAAHISPLQLLKMICIGTRYRAPWLKELKRWLSVNK